METFVKKLPSERQGNLLNFELIILLQMIHD